MVCFFSVLYDPEETEYQFHTCLLSHIWYLNGPWPVIENILANTYNTGQNMKLEFTVAQKNDHYKKHNSSFKNSPFYKKIHNEK